MENKKIGIITALEEETQAVVHYFNCNEAITDSKGRPCLKGIIRLKNESIEVINYFAQKGPKAKDFTNYLLNNWKVKYVFLIGIAGAIAEHGVNIGDIIIADEVLLYEKGSITKLSFIRKREIVSTSPNLLEHFRVFLQTSKKTKWFTADKRINFTNEQKQLLGLKNNEKHIPEVFIGKYFCGNKVVRRKRFIRKLLKLDYNRRKKYLGIDMESGYVLNSVLRDTKSTEAIVIKCASDKADDPDKKKWDKFHETIAYRAAKFLHYFLKNSTLFIDKKEQYTDSSLTEITSDSLNKIKKELNKKYEILQLLIFSEEKLVKMMDFIQDFLLYSKEFEIIKTHQFIRAKYTVEFFLKNNPDNKIWQTIKAVNSIVKISRQYEGIGSKLILELKKAMIDKNVKLGFYISFSDYSSAAHEEILKAKNMGYFIVVITHNDILKFLASKITFTDFLKNKLLKINDYKN